MSTTLKFFIRQLETERSRYSDTLKQRGDGEMRQVQAAGLLLLFALSGCRTSDRTITLERSWITVETHRFESDYIATTYSSDGQLMAGFSNGEELIEVREVSTGKRVGSSPGSAHGWFPALFSPDNESLVIVRWSGRAEPESAVVPVTGTDDEPETRSKVLAPDAGFIGHNYDFTLSAFTEGVVLFQDGDLVAVNGATGDPFFDQYGAVWYRTSGGWSSISRDKSVTQGVDRPGYLVQWQTFHRGSMHLLVDQSTLKHNDAEAYVTAVWLDHDKSVAFRDDDTGEMVHDRTALVYVGADVYAAWFVPNRKLVSIVTKEGTALVPYVVEPRPDAPSDR